MFQTSFVILCFCLTLVSGLDRELHFYYNREYRTQDLWNAIQANDTALFDTIISRNSTNLREKDAIDMTPLLMAVTQSNVHMTRALLSRIDELDIDAQDFVGHSALHNSCFDHNRVITRLLIEAGADVNLDSDIRERPIIMAQREDDVPLLELLVNAGAQINFQDDQGQSPLHEAAAYGALGNVRYLINHGANLTLREDLGFTAEESICYCQRVDERVEAPCLPGSCTEEKIRAIERVFRNARQRSNEPESSLPRIDDLWTAIVSRSMERINEILNCACVELQSVTQSTTDEWIEGDTALHLAIRTGVLAICEALVEAGADPESRNAMRNTPLHLAAMTDFLEAMQLLIERPLNVDDQNIMDQTALHLASFYGSYNATALLINNGVTLSILDSDHLRAVEILCRCLHDSNCPPNACASGQDIRSLAELFGDEGVEIGNQMIELYHSDDSTTTGSTGVSNSDEDETSALGTFIGLLFLISFGILVVYGIVVHSMKRKYTRVRTDDVADLPSASAPPQEGVPGPISSTCSL